MTMLKQTGEIYFVLSSRDRCLRMLSPFPRREAHALSTPLAATLNVKERKTRASSRSSCGTSIANLAANRKRTNRIRDAIYSPAPPDDRRLGHYAGGDAEFISRPARTPRPLFATIFVRLVPAHGTRDAALIIPSTPPSCPRTVHTSASGLG